MGDQRLLRISLLSSAHCGAATADLEIEGPTLKGAYSKLPVLPGSTLKGIMAGRFGDQPATEPASGRAAERERRFGSPDRAKKMGQGSAIVPGDGLLLAFPVPCHDGHHAWVFPVAALACCADRVGLELPAFEALARLDQRGQVLGLEGLPDLDLEVGLDRAPALRAEDATALGQVLQSLVGTPADGGPRLLAGHRAARELWEAAAEVRDRTAMEEGAHVVKNGSLRTLELVPAGSIFLSPITLPSAFEADASGLFQLGAWEGSGHGFVELSLWNEKADPRAHGVTDPTPSGDEREAIAADRGIERRPDRATLWLNAFHAFDALLGQPAAVRASARSAVYKFGVRARLQGFEGAVAFVAAKAKVAHGKPKAEARAHRWLLGALFAENPRELGPWLVEQGEPEPLRAWFAAAPFQWGGALASSRWQAMHRWLGLRRFAEVRLAGDEGETGGGAETPSPPSAGEPSDALPPGAPA